MKLHMEIEMDNAAFEDYPLEEAARILRVLEERLRNTIGTPQGPYILRDLNGNKVGRAEVRP